MTKDDLAQTVAAELAALHDEIWRMNRDLEEVGEGQPEEPVRGQLVDDLRAFREHLGRHFRLEEEGGYLEDPPDPGTDRQASQLVAEHRRIESEADELIERLEHSAEGRAELSGSFPADLRALLGQLAIHESKENALFQRIVVRDIGRGD